MGLQTTPAFISQAGYQHPAELMRNFHEAIAGGRSGIMRHPQFAVTGTAVANQIQITAGQAIVLGGESASQGAYFAWSDATELLAVPAPHASNPRIDTLLLRIADPQYGTITGLPRAYWEVVQGLAAASPTARADSYFNVGGAAYQPGAWLRVADIRRNVGNTTVLGNLIYPSRLYARIGDSCKGWSTASTTGFGGPPSDAVVGDLYTCVDTGAILRHNGTAWKTWYTEWITWDASFSILGSTTNPTKGNSSYSSRYRYINGMVRFEFGVSIGSTFNQGSGNYSIPLPVAADAMSGNCATGSVWINDSGVAIRVGTLYLASDAVVGDVTPGGMIGTGGMTWNSPDFMRGAIEYTPA